MLVAIQLDDEAFAVAQAFADQEHCSIGSAVNKLVVRSSHLRNRHSPSSATVSEVRFPLVTGGKVIVPEDVARLQDES